MACGVPVLVSVKAGVSEFLADGVDGILLTEPENAELLAKKLSGLLPGNEQGRELREKLGANGEKKARTFTWDRHAELVEDILVTMKR